jgi:CheY-specific phosphatase CheX
MRADHVEAVGRTLYQVLHAAWIVEIAKKVHE